ncbi:LptE family protein [Flammeovirgaceae bacterium SG7u.111]|nr:LptE family protein [Flammeovirgaceae bacterium SG7u.132]WPO34000.1 LptE family protein [Flammeovirgaceae bacterium SG7u.111]
MNRKYMFLLRVGLPLLIVLASCRRLPNATFTGFNLPPEVKTFSVDNFAFEAFDGPADLAIRFTEEMREYYQRNSPLEQKIGNGDLQFSGRITGYRINPVAAGAGEFQGAQLQRLTISVSVNYINLFDEETSFENQSFQFWADFPADENISDVEQGLIDEIFEQIIFDIYNKTVADW